LRFPFSAGYCSSWDSEGEERAIRCEGGNSSTSKEELGREEGQDSGDDDGEVYKVCSFGFGGIAGSWM